MSKSTALSWRYPYLPNCQNRELLKFGLQSLIIDTAPMSTKLTWPGVPEDAGSFTHVRYEDDLFTYSEFQDALEAEDPDEIYEDRQRGVVK